jgi:erythromycin esterase-like protein
MRTLNATPVQNIRNAASPLRGAPRDYDALLDRIGNSKFVLIGEASHGTHEFLSAASCDHETLDQRKAIYRCRR